MFGEYVSVRCEIARIDGLFAHADAAELCNWLATIPAPPLGASIVHVEPVPADAFRRRLRDELGWNPTIPNHGDTIEIP